MFCARARPDCQRRHKFVNVRSEGVLNVRPSDPTCSVEPNRNPISSISPLTILRLQIWPKICILYSYSNQKSWFITKFAHRLSSLIDLSRSRPAEGAVGYWAQISDLLCLYLNKWSHTPEMYLSKLILAQPCLPGHIWTQNHVLIERASREQLVSECQNGGRRATIVTIVMCEVEWEYNN